MARSLTGSTDRRLDLETAAISGHDVFRVVVTEGHPTLRCPADAMRRRHHETARNQDALATETRNLHNRPFYPGRDRGSQPSPSLLHSSNSDTGTPRARARR